MPEIERTLFWRTSAGNRVQKAVRRCDWKPVIDSNHTLVFDLGTDLSERQDLAGRRQDVAQTLRPLLDEWECDIDAEAKRTPAAAANPR